MGRVLLKVGVLAASSASGADGLMILWARTLSLSVSGWFEGVDWDRWGCLVPVATFSSGAGDYYSVRRHMELGRQAELGAQAVERTAVPGAVPRLQRRPTWQVRP